MSPRQNLCDENRVESYLQHGLGADEEAAFESHLDECLSCRERLERCAAEPSSWLEVRGFLGDERWNNDPHSGMTAALSHGQDGLRDPDADHFSADENEESVSRQIRGVLEALAPTDDPAMLGRIGAYEISGVVGCGGMGVVLKGFDPPLNRVVAIKVMAPHLASSGAARRRFSREAQAAAAITHENVIDIYGVDETDGFPYLVMPYARGQSLQSRIDQRGPLPLDEVLRIGFQIAAGLAAAHGQGLVHRDIKPANILLSDGIDRLVITDFGLARAVDDASVTKTGVITGTPQYMSPEQARGENIDQRSDLFSLGSVLYALCTGRPPFRAETTYGVLQRISSEPPRDIGELNPSVPTWLCRIISRLHAKDPAERYESAESVAQLFEQCLAHVQQPAMHSLPAVVANPESSAANPPRTRRVWIASFGAVIAVLLVASLAREAMREDVPAVDSSSVVPRSPIETPNRLRYRFPTGVEHAFLLTMSSELADVDTQLDGLVVAHVLDEVENGFRLRIFSDLQLSESIRRSTDESDDLGIVNSSGTHWRRWNGTRTGVAVISDTGDVISLQGQLDLPHALVSITDLIVPPLPASQLMELSDDGTQASFGDAETPPASTSSGGTTKTVTYGDTQIVFDVASGVVNAVQLDRTITLTSDNVTQRVPIHIEVLRISEEERQAWQQGRAESVDRPARSTEPLTTDEEARLLVDLQNGDRVLYWLHDLNRRPADSFSSDVVDGITALIEHPNQTYRTLARRLVESIPREQLNPFRVVE